VGRPNLQAIRANVNLEVTTQQKMHKISFVRFFKNFAVKLGICSGGKCDKMKILRKAIAVLDNDKPYLCKLFSAILFFCSSFKQLQLLIAVRRAKSCSVIDQPGRPLHSQKDQIQSQLTSSDKKSTERLSIAESSRCSSKNGISAIP
jgi:hypothetical protein